MKQDRHPKQLKDQMLPIAGKLAGAIVMATLFLCPAQAQQQSASATAPPETHVATSPGVSGSRDDSDQRYRIGPGDVLDIKVFNKPQFNREGVRVDPRGMIRMPLIKGEITAACHTEAELEAIVTELLKEYILEPQVTVQIKEYQSEPVAVLGAVRSPSRFQLQQSDPAL